MSIHPIPFQRNAALKPELKTRGKESSFVDRRFGENDPTMSVEDKMMARLIQEKSVKGANGEGRVGRE